MTPPKILVVHNDYQEPGGESAVVDAEMALLRDRGHELVAYRRHSREIRQFTFGQKARFFSEALYSRRTYREIRMLVAAAAPDVAHVHNVFPLVSPSVYVALRDCGLPIVQTVHNFRFACPNGLFYTHGQICERCLRGNTLPAVRLRCYRGSYVLSGTYAVSIAAHRARGTFGLINRLLVPSDFVAAKLQETGLFASEQFARVNYFVQDPLPYPGRFDERPPAFVYVGRLSPEKGILTLLDAVRGLPQATLSVIGRGPLEDEIRRRLQSADLNHVQLRGYVDGEEKWEALRGARAVIVPSECYELGPLTMIEGLMAGTAVVVPDLANFPEVVSHGRNGLLFKPGDAADLRARLLSLLAKPQEALAMGRRGREMAEHTFTAAAHYRALLAAYEQVVA